MKIQVIKKEETIRSSKVTANSLFKEPFDLNILLEEPNIEDIKIIITKSSQELEDKDKRFIKACGGYTPEMRVIRYFLLFFLSSIFIQTLFLVFTKIYPEHFYLLDNIFTVILFVTFSSFFISIIGLLFNSIFMLIRLNIFQRKEKKLK